jgi:NadR type nicotinamide-nucleotide adenylyltransferase
MLVDTARGLASEVVVLVRGRDARRLAWARECFGSAEVRALDVASPSVGPEEPAFFRYWAEAIRAVEPRADLLVTGDREAWRLADAAGMGFVLVDPAREAVPISASAIRADPRACWAYLPPPLRAHHAVRVSVVGPESSGKTTLARALAERLGTAWVPEHARTVALRRGGELRAADMPAVLAGQAALEDALARQCDRVLVADTGALLIGLWGERLFGLPPPPVARHADLYLITDERLPFVGPAAHDQPAARKAFATRVRESVAASGAPWLDVVGLDVSEVAARVVAARR